MGWKVDQRWEVWMKKNKNKILLVGKNTKSGAPKVTKGGYYI
jgi:hypothetical protein